MAGAGAKKRAEENKRKIQGTAIFIAVCAALHAVVRLWLRGSSVTTSTWLAFAATLGVQAFCFLGIVAVGKASYDASGALQDGGGDLSRGVISYYFDIVYVTGAVQVLAAVSAWGWYLYLVVPGYGGYMLTKHVVRPWLASAFVDEDAAAGADAAGGKKAARKTTRVPRQMSGRRI